MPLALAFDVNKIPLGPFDTRLWWLLIGLCVALLLTLQAVETAVEGAWPSDRRPSQFAPRARTVQASWAWVAMLIIPGGLLAIANVAALIWRDVKHTDAQLVGSVLLGIGWILFLLFSLDVLRLGRLMGNLGIVGPLALMLILIVGDILLLIGLTDILPAWHVVREAMDNGMKDVVHRLPIVGK